ncbi:MAG: hypothetical protein ACJ8G5_02345 [Burkholderiales bacterium]
MDYGAAVRHRHCCASGVDGAFSVAVLRQRSELSALAADCADLALHCAESSRLDPPRQEGTRCVLVWTGARGRGRLGALVPFGAPVLYQGLPLVALRSCTPLLRLGWEQAALHALLDWFHADGEGAALLEFRGLARGGPVEAAFAEVARRREQLVLAAAAPDNRVTLLVADRKWSEMDASRQPLLRWAKRSAASMLYGGLDL